MSRDATDDEARAAATRVFEKHRAALGRLAPDDATVVHHPWRDAWCHLRTGTAFWLLELAIRVWPTSDLRRRRVAQALSVLLEVKSTR